MCYKNPEAASSLPAGWARQMAGFLSAAQRGFYAPAGFERANVFTSEPKEQVTEVGQLQA